MDNNYLALYHHKREISITFYPFSGIQETGIAREISPLWADSNPSDPATNTEARHSTEPSAACRLTLTVYGVLFYLLPVDRTKTSLTTTDRRLCKKAKQH
jgi:hypothetical protein